MKEHGMKDGVDQKEDYESRKESKIFLVTQIYLILLFKRLNEVKSQAG